MNRPKTRSECIGGIRPCPWISCRHHLLLDTDNGDLTIHKIGKRLSACSNEEFEDLAIETLDSMCHTCTLDIVEDENSRTLGEISDITGMDLTLVKQIEKDALKSMRLNKDKLE